MHLIIFDLDGTLIDSVILNIEAITAGFAAVGEPVPTEHAMRAISGITAREAMGILMPNADAARIDTVLVSYRREHAARAQGSARELFFPDGFETLTRLRHRPDTILAVATGKGFESATALLTARGVVDWFHTIQTPTHNRGKPDPQMIHTAIEKAGAEAKNTVMIGDTVHDMNMAKAAGVKAIGVAWGYHLAEALREAGADIVIERFNQLEPAIDKLLP